MTSKFKLNESQQQISKAMKMKLNLYWCPYKAMILRNKASRKIFSNNNNNNKKYNNKKKRNYQATFFLKNRNRQVKAIIWAKVI